MTEKKAHAYQAEELLKRAEETAREKDAQSLKNLEAMSLEETRRTLHDLQVHKIELELQNEELRRAQAELQTMRTRYFDLYDLAPVGYFALSEQGLILEANLTAANLLGVVRNVLVKQPLTSYISREDQETYYLHHKRLFATRLRQVCELWMLPVEAAPFWARLEATVAQDVEHLCRVVISDITDRKQAGEALQRTHDELEQRVAERTEELGRVNQELQADITARKQAEEALRKAGALQNAIFNSANFSSIATDAKGVIQIFNVGAERMLGYTAADVMNKITPADISDSQEVIARAAALSIELGTTITPGFEALVFKASRGIEDIYELTYIRKDGSRFPAVVSVTALRDDQDAIIGYLLIGTDNTARKQVEAERERLDHALQNQNIELESAKIVAEKASQAKSDFLSSMSHELRSPLNAILGFAQLMESGSPPPTPLQMVSIKQILQGGWYLLRLINEILDLSAIESGRLSLSLEPVSLVEVMLECRAMMEGQAQKRRIQMTFPQIVTPWFINADQTRVKQVLINLLSNAIKYNHEGGTVVVDCTAITPGRIRISITDSGAGLSPKELAQLYQPFNRLGREISGEEGTGIGLVVSKQLVELMEGVIGVESTVGVGSVFWIELMSIDASQITVGGVEPTVVGAQAQGPGCTRLRTLLYVEDNPANMMLVEQIIARYPNIHLLTAVNGNSGIEIARVSQPEVILMDINLPDISGSEAMKILRADPVTTHIPVIALSANAIPRDIKNSIAAGFFQYLTKPIQVNEFMDALDVAFKYVDKEGGQSK